MARICGKSPRAPGGILPWAFAPGPDTKPKPRGNAQHNAIFVIIAKDLMGLASVPPEPGA